MSTYMKVRHIWSRDFKSGTCNITVLTFKHARYGPNSVLADTLMHSECNAAIYIKHIFKERYLMYSKSDLNPTREIQREKMTILASISWPQHTEVFQKVISVSRYTLWACENNHIYQVVYKISQKNTGHHQILHWKLYTYLFEGLK